jgi:hypothetical protein
LGNDLDLSKNPNAAGTHSFRRGLHLSVLPTRRLSIAEKLPASTSDWAVDPYPWRNQGHVSPNTYPVNLLILLVGPAGLEPATKRL